MAEVNCEAEVIHRFHRPYGSENGRMMWFVRCSCGELSQWFPERDYADAWVDKHKIRMASGVRDPLKTRSVPRTATVYQQYRVLQEDERYPEKDRRLFRQMADELEGRVAIKAEEDPDQLELF